MAGAKADGERTRRGFLRLAGAVAVTAVAGGPGSPARGTESEGLSLFLGGDVMTGRGIDQIQPTSVDPTLHEPWVTSAATYVEIAERTNGPIPDQVPPAYVWGDALDVLEARRPELRLVNLETSITARGEPWPSKGIHYRMHPANVEVLTAGGLDGCTLANNHVLDWGRAGLDDTLAALAGAGIAHPGAGADLAAAAAPATFPVPGGGRVLLFSMGHGSSGIPDAWAASEKRSGVWLESLSEDAADRFAERVAALRRPGDLVVASIHWGGNWGYEVPAQQQRFARRIIDRAGVDLVHGHSSHHPKGIEVHRGRPILYGCGDFINDYEGIRGHEEFRSELRLMYLPRLAADDGRLLGLEMVPVEAHRFRLRRPSVKDARWLADTLDRECRELGTRVELAADETLELHWDR